MLQTIVLSFPMALAWMILARQPSIEGFIVGYIFGFAVLLLVRINTSIQDEGPVFVRRIPTQILSLMIYGVRLAVDVFLSGIDVGWRVLQPNLPINPGVQRITTQDETKDTLISALSAHSITITPGELVIDYEEDEDNIYMLVHTLDKDQSTIEKLNADQTQRLKLIKRILGYE